MNIDIKKLGHRDVDKFMELIRLFEDVFEMENFNMPEQKYQEQLLEMDSFFVFVALDEGKVVGGVTAYTLQQYYSKMPLVYIYDLAVKKELQRRGIGKDLIAGLLDYSKRIGIEEVFVQADKADKHAVAFYDATGGTAEEVIHFNYPLNPNFG